MTRTRKYRALGSLALCGALLTAACTTTTAGTAEPARDSAGIIGIGRSIAELLPTGTELSRLLSTTMHDSEFPAVVGEPGVLSAPPDIEPECAAVVRHFVRGAYHGTSARAAARKRWPALDNDFAVDAAVVALASPHDAGQLFEQFVDRWHRCQDQTVIDRHIRGEVGIPDYFSTITDVKNASSMVTAMVILTASDSSSPLPSERALGVAYNCIVDVEVTDFARSEDDVVSARHARDVAALMIAKASA